MRATVPGVSPANIEVEAGYKYDISNSNATNYVGTTDANAHKITTRIGTTTATQYQLY